MTLKPARKVEITAKEVAAALDMQARHVPNLAKLGRIKKRGKGYDAASVHEYKARHETEAAKRIADTAKQFDAFGGDDDILTWVLRHSRVRLPVEGLAWCFRHLAHGLDNLAMRLPSTPEQVRRRQKAWLRILEFQMNLKRQGVTRDEVMGWIRKDRR